MVNRINYDYLNINKCQLIKNYSLLYKNILTLYFKRLLLFDIVSSVQYLLILLYCFDIIRLN